MNPLQVNYKYLRYGRVGCNLDLFLQPSQMVYTKFLSLSRTPSSRPFRSTNFPKAELLGTTNLGGVKITCGNNSCLCQPQGSSFRMTMWWPFFLPLPPYFHISVYFVSFMHAYDELCSSSHSNTLFHTPLYLLFLSVSPPTFSSSSQLPWCVYDSNNHIISWKAGPFPPLAFAVFAVPVLPCSLSLGVGVDTLSRTEDTALTYSQNCGQLYTIALTSDSAKRSFSHQDGEKCWPRDKHI